LYSKSSNENNQKFTHSTDPLTDYLYPFNYNQEVEEKEDKKPYHPKNKQQQQKQQQVSSTNKIKASSDASTASSKPQKSNTNVSKPSYKQEIKCHKKFSIGSYAHMLNEPVEPPVKDNNVTKAATAYAFNKESLYSDLNESDDLSEEQVIDDYYQTLKHKNPNIKLKSKTTAPSAATSTNAIAQSNKQGVSGTTELDKIAAKINSTGQQKWKNSTMPTKSSMYLDLIEMHLKN
jgi:hypothetical protein